MKTRTTSHQTIREALTRLENSKVQLEAAFGGKGLPLQAAAWARVRSVPDLTTDELFKLFYEQPEMSTAEAVRAHAEHSSAWEAVVNPQFLERMRRGSRSPTDVEHAIAYLEVDPWHFHSGYIKEDLARILRGTHLTARHRDRLGEAIVGALQKGKREDLKEYGRLARRVDSPKLRARLAELTNSPDRATAWRATYTLQRCEMNDYRRDLRGAR